MLYTYLMGLFTCLGDDHNDAHTSTLVHEYDTHTRNTLKTKCDGDPCPSDDYEDG